MAVLQGGGGEGEEGRMDGASSLSGRDGSDSSAGEESSVRVRELRGGGETHLQADPGPCLDGDVQRALSNRALALPQADNVEAGAEGALQGLAEPE